MRPGAFITDIPAFVQALIGRYGVAEIARGTGIATDDLERWGHSENHCSPQAEWSLYLFCVARRSFDILRAYATHLPSFDIIGKNTSDELDLYAPPLGFELEPPQVNLIQRPTEIAGLPVNFPFGISASILTRNSKTIAFFAARGFDLLTYKTVRSTKRAVHPVPNWVFIRQASSERVSPFSTTPIVGAIDYFPADPRYGSTANSFGVPSEEPGLWQPDVEQAKKVLHDGQVLIVSVIASPPPGDTSERALIDDFVRVARMAKEAGADIIEANFSCPNTPGDPTGELYQDPELSGRVSKVLSASLGATPLFVKIGYLPEQQLAEFVRQTCPYVQGVVAINTISMPVVSPAGTELFPNRRRAGISGVAIRPWATEVVSNLVALRKRLQAEYTIIGLGGVSVPHDVDDYLALGADAVEACTAVLFNPLLAIETRLQTG